MSKQDKKSKKACRGKKSVLMLAFGVTTLGARVLSAVSLAAIAISLCSVKKEAKVFNDCVEDVRSSGQSVSGAVSFCNGGK